MSYTVLARRYRSQSFDEVVGQDAVSRTLKNALTSDRVAHAYLFTGTRGVGKTTMARVLAKALNCLNSDKPTSEPCCKCESCLAINEGDDIDVLEIDGASNTGVEHIRELRQNAIYRPARARYKIYIIDEVHMLSTSAFNALLKTLEEPPDHVKFILATTEPNKVPATIHSRCQRFDFRNIKLDDIVGQLKLVLDGEKIKADDALVRRVARRANGSMRDALSLLDQLLSMADGKLTVELLHDLLGTPRSQRIVDLAEAVGKNDLAEVLTQIDAGLSEGLALDQLTEAVQNHFRDLMVLRNCGGDTELVELDDDQARQMAVEQAKQFDDAALVYNITVLEELRRFLRTGVSGRALLEAAMVRLTAGQRFSDTKVLLEQLQNLPQVTTASSGAATSFRQPQPTNRFAAAQKKTSETAIKPDNIATTIPKSKTVLPSVAGKSLTPERNITLADLQEKWHDILAEVVHQGGKNLEAYLRPAQPTEWADGKLSLVFNRDEGMGRFLLGQPMVISEIEQMLGKILSSSLKLEIVQSSTVISSGRANGTMKSAGSKPSQKEINTAMSDPKVRMVQNVLGGKVVRIDRVE
ncbi:MAG: DNA polymerase III subunit gamma/tau [Sedimentisphaerales bacterium]|nr:DNA polymerase III subunit gamma/tau [Sedimentisphaerales bacterium]